MKKYIEGKKSLKKNQDQYNQLIKMEPRSRETTPSKENLDFIVDDGYRHDEDPDFVSNDKHLVSGKDFKKLTRNAKKLGAESLDYSTRKNNKYMVILKSGKKVHFGSSK